MTVILVSNAVADGALVFAGASCIFSGRNVEQNINGGYTCYQGGSPIEQGSWRARRSY
jgi:hypothetical protein